MKARFQGVQDMDKKRIDNFINNLRNDHMVCETFVVLSVDSKNRQAVIKSETNNKEYILEVK